MCGFVAVHQPQSSVSQETFSRMLRTLIHRGPDGEGLFWEPPAALGHRRLSIVDLEGGKQPMSNGDGTLWIVYNGEIYNHGEWRTHLQKQGHHFQTDHSDTETLLKLYESEGPGCVHRLNGMFAFAIWDKRRETLFAARDRLGVKPLYYTQMAGTVLIASEIKALLACPQVPREIDPVALYQYFAFRYVPAPRTLFRGIYKLPPGHRMSVTQKGIRIERYWDVRFSEPDPAVTDRRWIEQYMNLLDDAVRLRLMSDVPLGAFLSGGLDSTAVAALAKKHSAAPLLTFSVGFGNLPGQQKAWDERPFSRLAASALDTVHEEIVVDADVCNLLPKLVWHMDEPIADPAALPTFVLSRGTRRKVTVALSGEGSDETLGGYGKYAFPFYNRLLSPLFSVLRPAGMVEIIRRLPLPPLQKRRLEKALRVFGAHGGPVQTLLLLGATDLDAVDALLRRSADREVGRRAAVELHEGLLQERPLESELNRLLYLEIKTYLPEQLLMKVDKMSMAASLEVRVPFLDYRLVELSAQLPPHLKVRGRVTKVLLKEGTRGLVPDPIRKRRKQGFSVPIESWFRGPLKQEVENLVSFAQNEAADFLDAQAVRNIVHRHLVSGQECGQEIWSLLVLKHWHHVFLENRRENLCEVPT